jgi:hypothetical protein
LAVLGPWGKAKGEETTVVVDSQKTVCEAFMGFGVQWDPHEYRPSPEAWRTILRRLDFMKPAFVRVMGSAGAYCPSVDAAGKPQYVFEQDEARIRKQMGPLLAILDYAQTNGVAVMLGEWGPPRGLGGIDGPGHPLWARMIADEVQWLRVGRGYTVVGLYNMMNEPNGTWMWPQGRVDYEAWSRGIRALRAEFDARGLSAVGIAGPDNAWGWEWIDRVSKTMPSCIGAWEMHWYAKDAEILNGEIERLLAQKRAVVLANDPAAGSKRFFLGEAGLVEGKTNGDQQPRVRTFTYGVRMADLAAQVARAGWQGVCAWDLDDAMHANRGHAVPPTADTLKVWGFWNSQGTAMGHPEDEAIRPWFVPWSLLCRLFPAGTRIVSADASAAAGLRVLAGVRPGRGPAFMAVNAADAPRAVRVRLAGTAGQRFACYRYFEHDCPVDAAGFPKPAEIIACDSLGEVRIDFPSSGVVFLDGDGAEAHGR